MLKKKYQVSIFTTVGVSMRVISKIYGEVTYPFILDEVTKGETWQLIYSVDNATAPSSSLLTISTEYEGSPSLTSAGSISDLGDSYQITYTISAAQTVTLDVASFYFSSKETFASGIIKKRVVGTLYVKPSVEDE